MSSKIPGPPYRIETERLVLRCWEPKDAPLLKEAADSSQAHLLPWMSWAEGEPADLQTRIAHIRQWRAKYDQDQDYVLGIFSADERRVVGGTGLHTRAGPDALEIGYWVRVDSIRQGYATEVAAALTKAAFEVWHVRRVEIHCDPANIASAAVPARLGYTHEATLRKRITNAGGVLRGAMIWSILVEEYPASPSASARIRAFDAMGREIELYR